MRELVKKSWFFITSYWHAQPESFLTILYLLGAIPSLNNKVFFVWSIFFVLLMIWTVRSFFAGLIYSFFPLSLFTIGQLYKFVVISPGAVSSYLYQDGRSIYLRISPFYFLMIMSVLAIPLLIFQLRKKFYISFPLSIALIISALELYSSLRSVFFPSLSMLFTIPVFGLISWGILLINYLRSSQKYKKVLNIFVFQLAVILLLHSSVAIVQVIKRAPLGLKIEEVDTVPYFGAGADENVNSFRPVGLRTDPNSLANELFVTECCTAFLWIYLNEKKQLRINQKLLLLSSLLTIVTIVLTQSRSVYLGFAIFITVLLLFQRKKIVILAKKIFLWLIPYKYTLLLLVLFLLIIVGDRLWRSQFSFSESGGYTTRIEMIAEASVLIQKNMWWGVGNGMYIPAAYQSNPHGVMQIFPEAVHNGFYLFLAENGIWSSFANIFFIYWLTRSIWRMKISDGLKWVYTSVQLALLVIMVFQPFINFITPFIVLSIILLEVPFENVKKAAN